MSEAAAITLLMDAQAEFFDIQRAKAYAFWRAETRERLGSALLGTDPFRFLASHRIVTTSSADAVPASRVGDWAIDQLVARRTPEAMLAHLVLEFRRNTAVYTEVHAITEIVIDAPCPLLPGVEVVPSEDVLSIRSGEEPTPTIAQLRQSFSVSPALVDLGSPLPALDEVSTPASSSRGAVRNLVRSACLLLGRGAAEFGASEIDSDRADLFAERSADRGMLLLMASPTDSRVAARDLKDTFDKLQRFATLEPLQRAIGRLGRARGALDPVDRALELGISAEIALTHADKGSGEISYRLATRMAWLLGKNPDERETVFRQAKGLYEARSRAVHEGRLSKRTQPDLAAGDRLVTRALREILERGSFPDWRRLTMGAG